jgi:hypothetical protein
LTATVQAASVEIEGAQKGWQAEIDEDLLIARFTETIGPEPGPVLKKFIDVNAAGAWTVNVTATNNTGQTWTDYHFDLLFPPPLLSTPGDGVEFDAAQGQCATIGAPQVCSGAWMVTPDSLWVQFNQQDNSPANVVPPGETVVMVFGLTISSPPANLPVSYTLAQHYTIPEPATLVLVGLAWVGAAGLARRRAKNTRRGRCSPQGTDVLGG